jgi:hypothetical protein
MDHLGSVETITRGGGAVLERYSFDVWGKRRNPDTWQDYTSGQVASISQPRGFTTHEHHDLFSLVNMNGRVAACHAKGVNPVMGEF